MFIVMIASECAPVAKVGGLGDVVFGLSRELELRGNAVEIILPNPPGRGRPSLFGTSALRRPSMKRSRPTTTAGWSPDTARTRALLKLGLMANPA